jgi:hypothetical protein
MSPLINGTIALASVFSAALLGIFLRTRLPDRYQASDSKEVVRLSMGLVVTTAALVLGLLVGSAKNFFDTQNAEMAQIGADYIMLDRLLGYYGPESADTRAELRAILAERVENSGRLAGENKTYMDIRSGAHVGDTLADKINGLSPKDDNQRYYKQQCLNLMVQLGQLRWMMFEQNTVPFPGFLMIVLLFWLILLFMSFGIFAPRNPMVLAGMFASATAVSGAILLILAMYHPQSRLIRVSDAPLRAAMRQIER